MVGMSLAFLFCAHISSFKAINPPEFVGFNAADKLQSSQDLAFTQSHFLELFPLFSIYYTIIVGGLSF